VTKDKALHAWFQSFGVPFYPASSVPNDVLFPYGTYELITSAWDEGEVGLTVNLWYYTESEAIPNTKAQEISNAIGMGGTLVPCDGGAIWIKRGSPWCQNLRDDSAPNIKRRYLNITAEYLTSD
jgi:hypothetical protein